MTLAVMTRSAIAKSGSAAAEVYEKFERNDVYELVDVKATGFWRQDGLECLQRGIARAVVSDCVPLVAVQTVDDNEKGCARRRRAFIGREKMDTTVGIRQRPSKQGDVRLASDKSRA